MGSPVSGADDGASLRPFDHTSLEAILAEATRAASAADTMGPNASGSTTSTFQALGLDDPEPASAVDVAPPTRALPDDEPPVADLEAPPTDSADTLPTERTPLTPLASRFRPVTPPPPPARPLDVDPLQGIDGIDDLDRAVVVRPAAPDVRPDPFAALANLSGRSLPTQPSSSTGPARPVTGDPFAAMSQLLPFATPPAGTAGPSAGPDADTPRAAATPPLLDAGTAALLGALAEEPEPVDEPEAAAPEDATVVPALDTFAPPPAPWRPEDDDVLPARRGRGRLKFRLR